MVWVADWDLGSVLCCAIDSLYGLGEAIFNVLQFPICETGLVALELIGDFLTKLFFF